jgi:imidazolonepropionase-like amidohydrolase
LRRRLLINVSLVDVEHGRLAPHSAVLIEDDRIGQIGPREDFPADLTTFAVVNDLDGRFVAPGFIDPHVHAAFDASLQAVDRVADAADPRIWALATRNAAAALGAGVTTMSDCGGPGNLVPRLRQARETGQIAGPRLLTCVNPITVPGGHCHHFGALAQGARAVRQATRRLLDAGADFVKIMASGGGTRGALPASEPQFSLTELQAAVDEAHADGRRVAAHARASEAIRRCVVAGVDRVEHLTWETTAGVSYDPTVAEEMARRGIWADPTLPAGYRALRSEQTPPDRRAQLERHFALRYPNYRRLAREAGVRLLCGTDAGTPLVGFDDFALGPELLVNVVGYSPAEALRSATIWAAQALGVADSRGTLAAGKLADLVVLREDPLRAPTALRSIDRVMLGGTWHSAGSWLPEEALQ